MRKVRNFACFKQANRPAPKSGGQGADALKTLFYLIGICVILLRATFAVIEYSWDAKGVKRHASFLIDNSI